MDKVFRIGDFAFRLRMDDAIVPPPHFLLFEEASAAPVFTYDVRLCGEFPAPSGRCAANRKDLTVFDDGGLETRFIGVAGDPKPYACCRETGEDRAEVFLDGERLRDLNIDPVFTSLFALEKRLAAYDAFVLHCAYIERGGEAILFSAPSETGKSTQGHLWEQYRGARTVNGDRALLQKKDGRWMARGWPVCGSSEICHDEEFPIRTIVMLSQGKEDVVTPLSPMAAFSQIYSQVTINRWNRKANVRVMDLLEELVKDVPVWHLACTISENAVDTLAAAVYPGEERP